MLVKAFITHKKAEHFSDCQDRFSINAETKSIALSDGMSQSIFQKYWAEILVEKFTCTPDWEPKLESVKELSTKWKDRVLSIIQKQKEEGNRSAYRAERNLIDGLSAGATFLGIRFDGYKWSCYVLGDTCMIRVRDNKIVEIISSEDIGRFDSYPDYFDSDPKKEGKGKLKKSNGVLALGDTILLVSDPFSDFLSKNRNTDKEAAFIGRLSGINSHREFESVVDDWRTLGMHNDDSTLVVIKHGEGESFKCASCDNICDLIKNEQTFSENQQNEVKEDLIGEPVKSFPSLEDRNGKVKVKTGEQSKIDWTVCVNDCFYKKLKRFLYDNLPKERKKQMVQKIIDEIKDIIDKTVKK